MEIKYSTDKTFTFKEFTLGSGKKLSKITCTAPNFQQISLMQSKLPTDKEPNADDVNNAVLPLISECTGLAVEEVVQLPPAIVTTLISFITAG